MSGICNDNRFAIIELAKKDLINSTNIATDKKEMHLLDTFLYRCWQMGWLDKYNNLEEEANNYAELEDKRAGCGTKFFKNELAKAYKEGANFYNRCSKIEVENDFIDIVLNELCVKPAYKDGSDWCILLGDDIQKGICGFGDTKIKAFINFLKELIELKTLL